MLAFLCATGNRPLANKSVRKMKEELKHGTALETEEFFFHLSSGFSAFVNRCLKVDPADRMSAGECADQAIFQTANTQSLFAQLDLLVVFRENLQMYISCSHSSTSELKKAKKMSEDMAACIVQRSFRRFTERRNVALEQQILQMERRESSAVVIQSLARKFLCRCLFVKMSKNKLENSSVTTSRKSNGERKDEKPTRDPLSLDLSKVVGVAKASAEGGKIAWKTKTRVPRVKEMVQQDRKERLGTQEPPRKDRKLQKTRPNDKHSTIHTFDHVVPREHQAPPPKLFKTLHHPRADRPAKRDSKLAPSKKITGRDTLFLADDSFREAHDEWVLEALTGNARAPQSSTPPLVLEAAGGWEQDQLLGAMRRGVSAFEFTDFSSDVAQTDQGLLPAPEIESDGEEEEQVVKSVQERRKKLLEITTGPLLARRWDEKSETRVATHKSGPARYQHLHAATISQDSSLHSEYDQTLLPQLGMRSKSLSARGSDKLGVPKASLPQLRLPPDSASGQHDGCRTACGGSSAGAPGLSNIPLSSSFVPPPPPPPPNSSSSGRREVSGRRFRSPRHIEVTPGKLHGRPRSTRESMVLWC
uniref:Protein kinase domain-containing protein n=1 Tax=Hanusia phi TaxID=3032 RepID=A0A7S0E5K4_9CRYP